ncbi:MAG TPA: DUF4245 domain-containing protein [Pilimelia sp.]|nr:DUF4245 domain-containing protein [Pilimelia sp.]
MSSPPVPPPAVRASRRPRDMVWSLLALLVPLAILAGVYRAVQGGDAPLPADAAAAVDQAVRAGDFPVAAPGPLPAGWRAASATYRRGDGRAALRLGYVAPSGAGLQLVQTDRPADAVLREELGGGRPSGTVSAAGRQWQRYPGRPGEEALVLLGPERTVLVLGPAGAPELAVLAGVLTHL